MSFISSLSLLYVFLLETFKVKDRLLETYDVSVIFIEYSITQKVVYR